jgi:polysaccharide export outer membrane protein
MNLGPSFLVTLPEHKNMKLRTILLLFIGSILWSSCSVNKDLMFQTPVGYVYDALPEVDSVEYRISPYDRVQFNLFTNDGYKLIDIIGQDGTTGNSVQAIRQFGFDYLVEADGFVKLPTLGRIKLSGYTIIQAQDFLQEQYTEYYRKPFVILSVVNNRVIVSPGDGGQAQVVGIRDNMTVIEVLARAGGVANRGNASKVKVIRNMGDRKEVYQIDLSTIEGIYDGGLIVQANDIIYVEPTPDIAREVIRDLTPIISLITSTLFLVSLFSTK